MATQGTPSAAPERGGCLTIYLVLVIVGSLLSLVGAFSIGPAMEELQRQMAAQGVTMPPLPGWYVPASIVAAILAVIGAVGVWMWKRWGVYVLILSFIVNVATTAAIGQIVTGIVAIAIAGAILWFVVKDKWAYMQ